MSDFAHSINDQLDQALEFLSAREPSSRAVFLTVGAGSGKTTQSALMVKAYLMGLVGRSDVWSIPQSEATPEANHLRFFFRAYESDQSLLFSNPFWDQTSLTSLMRKPDAMAAQPLLHWVFIDAHQETVSLSPKEAASLILQGAPATRWIILSRHADDPHGQESSVVDSIRQHLPIEHILDLSLPEVTAQDLTSFVDWAFPGLSGQSRLISDLLSREDQTLDELLGYLVELRQLGYLRPGSSWHLRKTGQSAPEDQPGGKPVNSESADGEKPDAKDLRILELEKQLRTARYLPILNAGLVHEINNPLQIALNALTIVFERLDDALLKSCVEDAMAMQRRIAGLIADLRLILRDDPSWERTVCNVQEVVGHAKAMLKIQMHQVGFSARVAPDLEFRLIRSFFLQILINLVHNAIKAYQQKPSKNAQIVVEAFIESEHLTLSVEDQAGGLPESVQEQLVRLAEQPVDFSDQHQGLALVLFYVRAHGGRIRVQTTVGEGTRFEIRLPASAAPIPSDQALDLEIAASQSS